MFDTIREWISDNLRYILIGLAGLVVLFVVVTGVRAIAGGSSPKNKKAEISQTTETNQTETSEATSEISEDTNAGSDVQNEDTKSIETAEVTACEDQSLITLIMSYYQAVGAQDMETVRVLTDELPQADQEMIEKSKDIEAFSDITVYSSAGLYDATYIVYATYACQYINFETKLPGLSRFYICTAEDGSYYISNGAMQEEVKEYIEAQQSSDSVKALIDSTQSAYEAALAADTGLAGYLQNKGQSASNALYAADGTELTVKTNCNVRAESNTSSTKLGQLAAGTKVVKEGSEAEWIKITFEGQSAFVRWDMFE